NNDFPSTLKDNFPTLLKISDEITPKHVEYFKNGDNASLLIGGTEFADALIIGDSELNERVQKHVKKVKKPVLNMRLDEDNVEGKVEEVSKFFYDIMESLN
ncbi:MAG: hypothetical protein RMJ53_01090, partial [Chitinophagales bacterium]|nr:hypothetical protein [Chitinophagales bacterium]